MKKSTLFWIGLLILISQCLISGCDYREKIRERWLCSVNIDGSGFRKVLKDNYPPQHDFLQIHATHNYNLIFARNNLLIIYEYYYGGQKPYYSFLSTQPFTGITSNVNGYYSYLTSLKSIFRYGDSQFTNVKSTNYFLGVPSIDPLGNFISMAGFNNQNDSTGSVIVLYNKNSLVATTVSAPQGVNKAIYSYSTGNFLCINNEAVYSMNINGTGYHELYRFETGNPGQWHSRYAFPLDNGSKFLVLKDNFDMVVVNAADSSQQIIGPVTPFYDDLYSGLSFNIRVSRDSRYLLYTFAGSIYRYDLQTNTNALILSPLPGTNQFQNINSVCSSWDGTKVYFIAEFNYEIEKTKIATTEHKFN